MDEYRQKLRNVITNYGKQFTKACRYLGTKEKTYHSLRHIYSVRRWAITAHLNVVSEEIGHASVVMTKHLPLLLFIGLVFWGCKDKDDDCPAIYALVCGSDGVTYGNDCYAGNVGVTEWT